MRTVLISLLAVVILTLCVVVTVSQDAPDTAQIYRLIQDRNNANAGDAYWVEVWEQRVGNAISWVMYAGERSGNSIEHTCSRAIFVGEGTPVYTINGELQNVQTAAPLRTQLEDARLITNASQFIDRNSIICETSEQATVNGYEAELCRFEGQDASRLFRIKGRATGSGALWTTDAGYTARYEFRAEGTADGSNNVISHQYELMPEERFQIQLPQQVDLQCFGDRPFPDVANAEITLNTLNYAHLRANRPADELRNAYSNALTAIDWEQLDPLGFNHDFYRRTLSNDAECSLSLRFQPTPDGQQTSITAEVSPQVDIEQIDVPEGFSEPIVVLNADYATTFEGTVEEAVASIIDQREDEGYSVLDHLTDIRDESAFVVLNDGATTEYVTIHAAGEDTSRLAVQTEDACPGLFTRSEE